MVFSSLLFCTIFLPICLLAYYGIPRLTARDAFQKITISNYILLGFSLLFYAFGGVKYIFLIALIILINWAAGFLCSKNRHTMGIRRLGLAFAVLADIGILFFFKYFNLFIVTIENIFFAENLQMEERVNGIITGTGTGVLNIPEIMLPVGISFFTFQALSYVIDVYNEQVDVQPNILNFALYISCFPQLIAGPIVHYKDIATQLSDRTVGSYGFSEGIKRFCFGLAKKVIIANTLAQVADEIWASDITGLDATVAWLGSICYTFQIYYDFSGYSDMAIGLGKMFGFDFKENFNHPYRAESIQDFWRRWHISLSSWFRDYVYIPLGGSRCGMGRTCLNIFIVFLLTGIWHGANWTFIAWGVIYGILLILERLVFGKLIKKNPVKFINRMVTFLIVNFLWVVFRADTIVDAGIYISRMLVGGIRILNLFTYLSGMAVIALLCGVLFGGFVQAYIKIGAIKGSAIISLVLLLISLLFLVNGTYNPFIYYQF